MCKKYQIPDQVRNDKEMLDIKFIHDNRDELKKAIENKRIVLNLEELLMVDEKRRELLQAVEELNAEKNNINDQIQKANPEERAKFIAQGKSIKEKMEMAEPEYKKVKKEFEMLMAKVPNIPSADTPIGKNEDENVEIFKKRKYN